MMTSMITLGRYKYGVTTDLGMSCDQCRGHGKQNCYGKKKVSPSWYGLYLGDVSGKGTKMDVCTPLADRALCLRPCSWRAGWVACNDNCNGGNNKFRPL